jgi:hypothetical protein
MRGRRAKMAHLREDDMKRTALAAVAMLVVACVSTNVALLDTSVHYVPTCKDGVAFYLTKDKAPQSYKEVALLNSSGASQFTDQQKMLESMREKAAEVGATGVILNEIAEPGAGAQVAGAIFGVSPQRHGKAVAIYAADDTARVRQACSLGRSAGSQATTNAAAPTPGSTASVCVARDTVTRAGDQIAVSVHEEREGQGCVEFRNCHYPAASVWTNDEAIAHCRGEAKKEE